MSKVAPKRVNLHAGTLVKNGALNCVEVGRRTEAHGLKSAGLDQVKYQSGKNLRKSTLLLNVVFARKPRGSSRLQGRGSSAEPERPHGSLPECGDQPPALGGHGGHCCYPSA
jgi:hypothetical protein